MTTKRRHAGKRSEDRECPEKCEGCDEFIERKCPPAAKNMARVLHSKKCSNREAYVLEIDNAG